MRWTPILALLLPTLGGCSSGMGVSPGGPEDIRYAREIIESGSVPSRDAFAAEGLFSEHDLPMTGGKCAEIRCPRADAAVVRPLEGGRSRCWCSSASTPAWPPRASSAGR